MPKRTIENCSLIRKAKRKGLGLPERCGNKCVGYAGADGDEPHVICQECKLNFYYAESHDTEMKDEYMRSGY